MENVLLIFTYCLIYDTYLVENIIITTANFGIVIGIEIYFFII